MSKTAFVFPGQGSQKKGMLKEIARQSSVVSETFSEASETVGFDLWKLIQQGPEEDLNKTENTQPALLTSSVALWRIWQQNGGITPSMLAGHSLGEYSALVCAGAIGFAEAVKLVQMRGQFMQSAVPAGSGSMAAIIGLDNDAIINACTEARQGEVVSAVNFNAPGQVVIAGNRTAVDRAITLCKKAGALRALPLPVSVPSHCELMGPAAEKLAAQLENIPITIPAIDVIQNVTAQIADSPAGIKQNLVMQLYSPVLWVDTITYMADKGIEITVECGPGKVLSGLNKRIKGSLQILAISDLDSVKTVAKLAQ